MARALCGPKESLKSKMNAARVAALTLWLLFIEAASLIMVGATLPQSAPWRPLPKRSDAIRVLVVTGGHDYDASFYSLFEGYDDISAVVNPHPGAFRNDLRKRVEVLVLYDMVKALEPERQKHLRNYIESGKGLVVLHHAICDYLNWPWWYEEVIGGRWCFNPAATAYQHDQDILVRPVAQHPITRDFRPFRIWDETYKGLWISPKVQVLLETNHPLSDGPLGWISPYEKSRVIYLQLGHDRSAHLNPEYRRLVRNAILWSAGRLK